jgi:subtilisin family serine protease
MLLEAAAPQSVVSLVEELGGRVTQIYENIDALAILIPAKSVDALLNDPRVTSAHRQRLLYRTIVPFELPQASGYAPPRSAREAGEEVASLKASEARIRVRTIPLEELGANALRSSGLESFLGYDQMTGAAQSWEAADFGRGIVVGVIDSGIYPSHPLYAGNVIGGINLVPSEEERAIDANSDGIPEGRSFDWDAIENDSHGTLIAGMIAGHADLALAPDDPFVQSVAIHSPESVGKNEDGQAVIRLMGTAPGASLYAVKVFPYDGGFSPDARVIEAIDHLITLKRTGELDVSVVNMSLSGAVLYDGNNPLDRIVDEATRAGITMVAAASNDGPALTSVGSPGSAKTALTVGAAVDPIHIRVAAEQFLELPPGAGSAVFPYDNLQVVDFSSRGRTADGRIKPDLLATGFAVFTSNLVDFSRDGINDTASFGFASGTSLSTPTVTGAAALVTAFAERENRRLARAPHVAGALRSAARPIARFRDVSSWEQGFGFVNIPEAFANIDDADSEEPNLRTDHRAKKEIRLSGRSVHERCPPLGPGEQFTYILSVPEDASAIHFEFPTVTVGDVQGPLGDALEVSVHTAKRGGTGDYVFFESPIAPGDGFTYPFPEPGEIRLTMAGFLANYSEVSGSFRATLERDRHPFPIDEVLQGKLRRDEIDRHTLEVPEGLEALAMRLEWKHDWSLFPTFDLDLYAVTPDSHFVPIGATLDAPELVWIEDPVPGPWRLLVVDASSVRNKERYKLEVAFLSADEITPRQAQPAAEIARARVSEVMPNPFRSATEIGFALPQETRATLKIFDVAGRLVRTIADADLASGEHRVSWDGRSEAGVHSSPGVYFVRLDARGVGSSTRKVVLAD